MFHPLTQMKQDNRKIIEALYQAFAERYTSAIMGLVSPDVVITQSPALPWGGHYSGYFGVQKFFAALLGHVDSKVEIERMLDAGDHVVAIGRTKGTVCASGKAFDVPIAHVWRIQNGRVTAFNPFIDNRLMLEALKTS